MAKRGPKGKPIDVTEFEKLCGLQCTLIEIAGWFSVSEDTIESWCKKTYSLKFSEVFRLKRQHGVVSLRRRQMQAALSGSIPMLIFLGKQYLGQADKVESKDSTTAAITLNYNDKDLVKG